MLRQTVLAFLAAILFVPLGAVQEAAPDPVTDILNEPGKPVTFYGHIFAHGLGSPMPMNTQFPSGEADYSIGQADGCGSPPPVPDGMMPNEPSCETWAGNAQMWYSTAGFVQVKSSDEWGGRYSEFHNERGMTKDVYVDTTQTPVSTYYMSADFHGWLVALCAAVCWNWDPGMFQDWVVESWLWNAPLGELHSNASEEPNMNNVITRDPSAVLMAHGKTEPIDMISLDPTVPTGEKTVYPFVAEMEWDPAFAATNGAIPLTSNIVAEFRWYQETNGQKYIIGPATVFPNWNVNGGEDYPANIVIPVRNPIDVELVYPQFIHDKLVILSIINTPWGSYDVAPELIKLLVRDADGNLIMFKDGTLGEVLEQSVAHSGHYNPIKPTWVWDYKAQGLKPGAYTVTVEVTNFQGSVTTSTDASFTITADGAGQTQEGRSGIQTVVGSIHDGHQGTAADPNAPGAGGTTTDAPADSGGKKTPGPALPLAAIVLACAALLWRRRS